MTPAARLSAFVLLALGALSGARAGHATPLPNVLPPPCPIPPGVYAITHPTTGELVGALIVYPDCRTEIVPVDHTANG